MIIELNKQLVEIDDSIASEIVQLNKKGYRTTACCGGHFGKSTVIYVTFDKRYDFPLMPSGFGYNKKNVIEFIDGDAPLDVYERMFSNFQLWVKSLPKNRIK